MKSVVEAYLGIWLILLLLMICIAFTSINMNVVQARNVFNSVRTEVQASNGSIVSKATNSYTFDSSDVSLGTDSRTLLNDGFTYNYTVKRINIGDNDERASDETFQYNSVYLIELKYTYAVPLFGRQVYPISGYAY